MVGEAYTLIPQLHEAAEQGKAGQVESLVDQIHVHTSHAIAGTKEQKQ
jgi:hypothetical protein